MSEPEVTITLGRTGQVVTKGGKRSRGDNNDGYFSSNVKKRLRGSNSKWTSGVGQVNGSRIARNDLRLKLNRKRASKQIQNTVEEHQKTYVREKVVNQPDPTTSSYMLSHRPYSNGSNLSKQIPSNNMVNGVHSVDSWQNLHSSQTMGRPRSRSPNNMFRSSNVLLPSTSVDEIPKVSWTRSAVDLKGVRAFSNEVLGPSRRTGPIPFTMKTPAQASNSLIRASSSGIVQNISHMREEPLTVSGFLHALGLGKYAIHFQAEEVDMTVLRQMRDNDLKEMGIPMGPRKKILLALLARQKPQPSRLQH